MPSVLLVEPDEQLAGVICKYLQKSGFEVVVAGQAQDAVTKADASKPDIVVLELAIPKNNGLAFLQEFRSYTDWLDVPIVIYSHIPKEDAGLSDADWQKQGVGAYLYKSTSTLASLTSCLKTNLNEAG